ncbi:MAG: EVE domain-containing protein [Mycobacterium sp.]
MTNWIVQSSPEQYDQDHSIFLDYWNMTRYSLERRRREIRPGDHVAVWISGRDGGVVAFAEIGDGEPFPKELREEDGWLPGSHLGKRRWHWPLVNARRLDQPILKSTLLADPRFKDALIIKTPFGHNPFPLTDPEWDAIRSRSGGMAGP